MALRMLIFTLSLLVLLPHSLAHSGPTPACLANCINSTTHPCTHNSLAALMTCITAACHSETNDISLNYTPKTQYSCQQSFVPGSENTSATLKLHSNGDCVTSPYDFSSFIASAGSSAHMREVAERCHMTLYEREHCAGGETRVEMRGMEDDGCSFHGGRSARLSCESRSEIHLASSAVLDSIYHRCYNSTSPAGNGTAPIPSSAPRPSGAPRSSREPSPSNTANATTTHSATPPPYPSNPSAPPIMGAATNDYVSSPSAAALVALIAVALAML